MKNVAQNRANDLAKRRARREDWLKSNGPCKCGSWVRLEVHHINPAEKVSHNVWSWSKQKREAELEKCRPLCHECHKVETAAYLRSLLSKPTHHGTQSGYRRGCRCDLCGSCYRLARRKRYERQVASSGRHEKQIPVPRMPQCGRRYIGLPPHGTFSCYQIHGCRCDVCREFMSSVNRRYYERRRSLKSGS